MAETTYNITLTANHQSLTAEHLPLAAESVQYLTAKVVCETEDWTGREIKAMFGRGCTVYEIPVTGGEITAKQQLNLTAGDWRVWLVGNSARDGDVIPRITTNVAHIRVAPTGGTEGNPFPAIPPTVEEQLRADMGNLADLTTNDKSSLVAAINEAAESGGSKDAVTYTPQTLTEEQQAQARKNITVTKSYQIPTTTINDHEVRVDGWAAAPIGIGRPSGFSIILSDVLNGALPFFVANGTVFLCTGVDSSGAHKVLTFVGFASSGSLSSITYKNAQWEDGLQVIYIYPGSVNPNDIEERAQTAYFYVGSYGYIYGQHYEELVGDKPTYEFAQKYPCAVVDGKFNNAVLPLFGIYEELKQIVYARTDATPDGNFKIQGLIVGDMTTPFEVIDIDIPVYIKPASGIPKTDLEQSVQTSLAKADTAILYNSQTLTTEQQKQARANIGVVQPDWNQNDSTQPDYVKNRPFYTGDPVETVLVEESTVTFIDDGDVYIAELPSTFEATVGETYKVSWDGTTYECACVDFNNILAIGNLSIIGAGSDTGEPFVIGVDNGKEIQIFTADTSASHTVSISGFVSEVVKIDAKYLPNTVWSTANAAKATAENAQTTAENAQTTAENAQTTANAAQSTANAAQTAANAAQSTANAAQSKAESIKPNWNENNSSKPGYIANRPFYHDIITAEIPGGKSLAPSAKLLIDGTELYWSGLVSDLTGLLQIDGNKIYMLDGTLEKFTPVYFRTGVNSYSYDYALGNPHLIKAHLPSAKDAHGGELPDTGGDWVYFGIPGSSPVVTISKTKGWHGRFVEFLSEDLKLLDEKFIPASIQRTGGEVFLHSSTPNSTKKFKITVDDNGTISATEVS